MTVTEAIALANQLKPTRRASFDKLQGSRTTTAADLSEGVTALSKRFHELAGDVTGIRKSLDQMRADVDHITTSPGAKRRIIH